jgi:hypothetical protein
MCAFGVALPVFQTPLTVAVQTVGAVGQLEQGCGLGDWEETLYCMPGGRLQSSPILACCRRSAKAGKGRK